VGRCPAMRDARLTTLDVIAVLLTGLVSATLVAFPHVVAPRYREMFADFGAAPLPALTRLVLSTWFPTALGAATATGPILGCIPAIPLTFRRIALVAAFVLGLASFAVCLVGLYLPIFALADSIKA
jgi:type II secretory pathway component PulF